MSRVFFISDLHFGHKRILEFAGPLRDGDDVTEHDHILVTRWNATVHKRDLVYVCGDVCMHDNLDIIDELNGRKILIRGNHDNFKIGEYLKHFEDVQGICKYKGFWVSHAPIHPAELRGKSNIHGHVHGNSIRNAYHEIDPRYINVCCEATGGWPYPFEKIKDGRYHSERKC